jgi:hypothetical protein
MCYLENYSVNLSVINQTKELLIQNDIKNYRRRTC